MDFLRPQLHLLILTIFSSYFFYYYPTASQSIIKTLPGFPGQLPFKLETGYVNLGEPDEIELFYYFIESERDPVEDPLILWITGGPGCSGLCGLAFEIGPIAFDSSSFNGSMPSLILRQHSWTKVASIIFIDQPVGTGFSYSAKGESYHNSDTLSAKNTYTFMRKWLLNHPKFIKNQLYVGGDSYGGWMVPLIAAEISKGNDAGLDPPMFLQGYSVGNPFTDGKEKNERIPYAHSMGLISHEYYESAKHSCSGQYVNPDASNAQCLHAIQLINKCIENVYLFHILEPSCGHSVEPKENEYWLGSGLSIKQEKSICREDMDYVTSYAWANNPEVRNALGVRKGTTKEWEKCNTSLTLLYENDVPSAIPYHQFLGTKQYRALVYSGDHDMSVPYTATYRWVQQLNFTTVDSWRPWNVNDQIAGYVQSYKNNDFSLTYATVKGAGHTAPQFKPEECLAMVQRFYARSPL